MTLGEYFEKAVGLCVLSSADGHGQVTAAVYSAPRVLDDNTVAFVMRRRLTYRNVRENPHAACIFIEHGGGYRGLRLFLTKVREDNDPALISRMTRRHISEEEDKAKGPKHLVIFKVDRILPLIGDGPTGITEQ
ncbi:MAG: pyridoxamine 5'-phosphate oxidase family protein [Nitrospirae bacterium]|nr:pyridoxamine 5'-phosphate oxidase family protein [Nitrospirota bacterium]